MISELCESCKKDCKYKGAIEIQDCDQKDISEEIEPEPEQGDY